MGQQVVGAVVARGPGGARPAPGAHGGALGVRAHGGALGARPLAAVALAVLTALAAVLPAAPATAHDRLVSSDPADGAVLAAPPAQVVLTFSAEPLAVGGAAVVVTGPDGASWSDGAAVVAGTTVTQTLRAGMPAGAYAVTWQSPSSDGHVLDGAFAFTVEAPAQPTAAPTPEPAAATPGPTDGPTSEPTAEPSAEPTGPDEADEGAEGDARDEAAGDVEAASDPGRWLLSGLAVVVVAAVVLAVVLRRRGGGEA